MRILARLAISFFIVFSGVLHAQEHEPVLEMKRLQAALAVVNAELRSDLDQIMVLQEAIRANARPPLAAQGLSPDMVTVGELADAQRRAILRETALNARLDALLARSAALDAQKQPLLERVRELSVTP